MDIISYVIYVLLEYPEVTKYILSKTLGQSVFTFNQLLVSPLPDNSWEVSFNMRLESSYFCELGAHAKFRNPRTTPSGILVMGARVSGIIYQK